MPLNTHPNITGPDDFYQDLIDLHRDLSEEESAKVNAKLILLLANHIGDRSVLSEAMRIATPGINILKRPPPNPGRPPLFLRPQEPAASCLSAPAQSSI